jgi:4-hydroxybenzoate polyprenyltransferase
LRAGAAPWTTLELLHPIPSLLTSLAAAGFAWLFGIGPLDVRFWWIVGTMLLVQFSISALNEWADADLDRRSGRRRPIPLGLVSPGTAMGVAVVCALGAFLMSAVSDLGALPLLLVGIGVACGWAYDLWLKPTPLSFLPFALAFPLMPFWIGLIAGRPASALQLVFLGGAPLATAIHLADSIPDRERDQLAGLNTLAVALGRPAAELVAAGLLLIGTLVSIIVLLRHASNAAINLSIVAVAVVWLVLSLGARDPRWRRAPMIGKWAVIAAAAMAAVPLVVIASGR